MTLDRNTDWSEAQSRLVVGDRAVGGASVNDERHRAFDGTPDPG
jgi:hypothetical protein